MCINICVKEIIAIWRKKFMAKNKKNKIRKLTEEQYNEYLMALKDEVPPKIIRETEGNE